MEIAVSTVVVALMLVAALNMLGGVCRNYAIAQERQRGFVLAEDLMEEILQTCYEDPDSSPAFGLEGGESSVSRTGFDDVDDYAGWKATVPEAKDGTPMANASGWTREAAVSWADPLDPRLNSGVESGLKRIVVTVTSPRGQVLNLTGLRCSSGMLELRPPLDCTYIAGVRASLQVAAESTTSVDNASVSNHARDE